MWSSSRVKKCGWLMKQSGVLKTWHRRWFVLSEDGRMTYHKSCADWSSPGVTIHLANCDVVQDRVAYGSKHLDWPANVLKECCFVVSTRDRKLFLYAPTKEECSVWLVTLQQALLKAPQPRSSEDSPTPLPVITGERRPSIGKIDKLKRRLSSVGQRSTSSGLTEKNVRAINTRLTASTSDHDELSSDSASVHSGGNLLDQDDDITYMAARRTSSSDYAQTMRVGTNCTRPSNSSVLHSWQNARQSRGLSKHRLPPKVRNHKLSVSTKRKVEKSNVKRLMSFKLSFPLQVASDIQSSVPSLIQAMGQINAVTGHTYTFLCDFGEIYKAVSWHLTGAGRQAAAQKEKVGTIVYQKYLLVLSSCLVELCDDPEQRQHFIERTWERRIEFCCDHSPFQEHGCQSVDCWLDSGILHITVLAKYFGEQPFQPMLLSLPEVGVTVNDEQLSVRDSGISSNEGSSSTGDGQTYSSLGDKTSSSLEELPEALREDIANSSQLLHVALQVIAEATKVPFTFDCHFALLYKLVDAAFQNRLGSIVHGRYLMGLSAKIVEYCEDQACREELVRNVYTRRIVMIVDDEQQLEATWGYVTLTPFSYNRPRTHSGDNLSWDQLSVDTLDTLDSSSSPMVVSPGLGGQVVCHDGILYMTVPLECFGRVGYEPSLDVFEARRPYDECSAFNNFVTNYTNSNSLPKDIRIELQNSTCILQEAMESMCNALHMDLTLECNFDRIYLLLKSAYPTHTDTFPALGTTIYGHYVTKICERLTEYIEQVPERASALQKKIYNSKINFLVAPTMPSIQQMSPRRRDGSSSTFLHRGVIRIMCPPTVFGKDPYDVDFHNLPFLPDSIPLALA